MADAIAGFSLLNDGGYKRDRCLWQIIGIHFGHETDYSLLLTLKKGDAERVIRFNAPLAYRVQEDRDLLHYWVTRDKEGVGIGVLYSVETSPYRSEFMDTVSAQEHAFQHYLVAGRDLCVEVLTEQTPLLPKDW